MALPIDTSSIRFTCTRAPERRTVRETGQPRVDRDTGRELWQVQVMALVPEGGEILAVSVPGEPTVSVGQPVFIEDLVGLPWAQEGRAGIAYRASAIRAAGPAKTAGNAG
ncbi:MAG: hypothetical protein ACRDTS_19525 [Mycobacterium sp.]